LAALLMMAFLSGCLATRTPSASLPARHSVRLDNLLVLSDFRLGQNHPLIQDLLQLRRRIATTLNLPVQSREVVVYLFANERQYRKFLDTNFPDLPPRRAYFVGTPDELSIYTFWGDRVQEDLRHEFTHGLLHASLVAVPLWLDEGLAEYFEVSGIPPDGVHADYARNLQAAITNGWRPNLERLEHLMLVQDMTRSDYEEAWAWVHVMLHRPEWTPELLGYLSDLRQESNPTPLSQRLRGVSGDIQEVFVAYVASLSPVIRVSER